MKFNSLKRLRTIRSIEPALKNVYGRPITLAIIDRKNQAFEIRTRDFIRVANAHIASLPRPTQQIWSPFLVGNNIGSSIEFQGVGMGHGVGLCQYGAQELAGQGMSWEDILAWYYPKSSLTA